MVMPVRMAAGDLSPIWPIPDVTKQVYVTGGKRFGASRRGGTRYHVGIDILAPQDAIVVAPEAGEIVAWQRFNGPKAHALLMETDTGIVILFGEVYPGSWEEFGLQRGSRVLKGQPIARVGINPGGSTMLHFETYKEGTRTNKRWMADTNPPRELLNPTRYLQRAAATEGDEIEDIEDTDPPDFDDVVDVVPEIPDTPDLPQIEPKLPVDPGVTLPIEPDRPAVDIPGIEPKLPDGDLVRAGGGGLFALAALLFLAELDQ
jgi:hypothetical protein